ncbi:MAG TPA: cytochrome c [Ideonella sp.]|nr:cytochrome c [Ideonella sp.]
MLQALHALGLTGEVAGQAAWPFGARIAVETLLIDRGLARQIAWALAALVFALLLAALGTAWRRGRLLAWLASLVLLLATPWPPLSLVLAGAVPTSFHRSPLGFEATAIARGRALYRTHCLACHGADGRGEGPAAASLPVWPPTLSAGLLWKRSEGELLWRVLHGMHNRRGETTMPGFAGQLDEADAWALLDGMRALSAGVAARREASWPWPVRAPDFEVACGGQAPRPLASWRGQRLRIVAGGGAPLPQPLEDPRLVTVVLQAGGSATRPDCIAASPGAAWQAYALVAGVDGAALAGMQFIVDREGWLRALARPGQGGWSEDSLICRSDGVAAAGRPPLLQRDGLGALIARMDGDPVQSAGLGLAHGR